MSIAPATARATVAAANAAGKMVTVTPVTPITGFTDTITGTARWVGGSHDVLVLFTALPVHSDGQSGQAGQLLTPFSSNVLFVENATVLAPAGSGLTGLLNYNTVVMFTFDQIASIAQSTTAADATLGTIVNDVGARLPDPNWVYGNGL